jgi:hypothetical protein
MSSSGTDGNVEHESIAKIRNIIEDFAVLAARREEAIQRIQQGLAIELDSFAGPSVVILNAAPGLGKTHALVKAAEELWGSLPVLHLAPTHDSFENVDRREGWGHWRGHDDGRKSGTPCPHSVRATKGYTSGDECNCTPTAPKFTGEPTFAPVNYIVNIKQIEFPLDADQLLFPKPLADEALKYPWWAIDDVGLDRFVGKREVTKYDLDITSGSYPAGWTGSTIVRQLSAALSTVLEEHTLWVQQQSPGSLSDWSGLELYDRLDATLRQQESGVYLPTSLAGFKPSQDPWPTVEDSSPVDWPQNFMPHLVPKLMTEAATWFSTRNLGTDVAIHPHIHVVWDSPDSGGPLQSLLRIRWRNRPSLLRPILILDATGNLDLLERAFRGFGLNITESEPVTVPQFPSTMTIRQYWGHHLNSGTLKSDPKVHGKHENNTVDSTYRALLIKEIETRCKQSTTPLKVGIITFKAIVEDAAVALAEAGVAANDIFHDYYWNVRGSNSFTDCDIVVLMGYPIPNPQGLYEEACVLYDGDLPPISRERQYFAREMMLRNGRIVNIDKITGYGDPRLQALYEQKSLSELYQAFHRARPYGPSTSVKEVLLFTDIPVEGVPVDGFFCEGRHGRAFDILDHLLDEGEGKVTGPQLVDAIKDARPDLEPSRKAVDTWVRRQASVSWLTQATGCEFIHGTSKSNPNLFRRILPKT